MHASPTPFDTDAGAGSLRAIIRCNPRQTQEIELIEAAWGTSPVSVGGPPMRFARAESRTFPDRRCLVAASEFHMGSVDRRYRVTLDDGNFFYLAGIWQPARDDWPLSFRIITVAANSEVARYQHRHGAVIQRRQVMQWLDLSVPEIDLLQTPPARTFRVDEIGHTRQPMLAFG